MPSLRPLSDAPNLEHERKAARRLLRQLRGSDAGALSRAETWLPAGRRDPAGGFRLSDAQLVLAREYGFASWPRLVGYFATLERQQLSPAGEAPVPGAGEQLALSLLGALRDRRTWAARSVAAFVPRLHGAPIEAVFTTEVTPAEARLAVARLHGAPSWAALLKRSATADHAARADIPWAAVRAAVEGDDIPALRRIAAQHPTLLDQESAAGRGLIFPVLVRERERGRVTAGPVAEWLASEGLDLRLELTRQLCGGRRTTAGEVRWLLDRGADPDWVAPNGVSVLEQALVRYWNGPAVDVLAGRAARRDEFWIAAGMGDTTAMRRFLSRTGRITAAARRARPPFDLAGQPPLPLHPDPNDEERLMEVFTVAMVNGRLEAMRLLAAGGFDVNSRIWDSPVLNLAVQCHWPAVVETLLDLGADPDLRGWRPEQSARELAREQVAQLPNHPDAVRIAAALGVEERS